MPDDQQQPLLEEKEIKLHLGKRLRRRRRLLGMTQQDLGTQIGVRFQQVQKYECGADRVNAERLYLLSKSLNAQPSYFFEGGSWSRPDSIKYDASLSRLISITNTYNKVSGKEDQGNIDVNKHIGSRLKALRQLQGFSQGYLGNILGVRFQQIQKYEMGNNRITAGKLFMLATALNVSPDFFFEGLPGIDPKKDSDLDASMKALCQRFEEAHDAGDKKTIAASRQKIMEELKRTWGSNEPR